MPDYQFADLESARIAYHDVGEGDPILLIHGFASNGVVNWINTNWVRDLNEVGYRCIAIDNRGHGQSQKFHSPVDYGPDIFADDALQLLDHLGIERCDIMGFSMGTRITSWICAHNGERVRKAVFGGMGARIFGGGSHYETIAQALETDDPDSITDPRGKTFRTFADRTASDRLALAACIRPSTAKITTNMIASITVPVLVAVGDQDEVGGSAEELAAMLPNARAAVLPGLDHMKSTGSRAFKQAAIDFLKEESS